MYIVRYHIPFDRYVYLIIWFSMEYDILWYTYFIDIIFEITKKYYEIYIIFNV